MGLRKEFLIGISSPGTWDCPTGSCKGGYFWGYELTSVHDLWYLSWEKSLFSGAWISLFLFLKYDDLQWSVTVWRIFMKPEIPLSSKKPLTEKGSSLLPWLSYFHPLRSPQCADLCRKRVPATPARRAIVASDTSNCLCMSKQFSRDRNYCLHSPWLMNYKTFSPRVSVQGISITIFLYFNLAIPNSDLARKQHWRVKHLHWSDLHWAYWVC